MGFSLKQARALSRSIPARFIRSRTLNGQDISYVEGWYALASANRLFGFEGWDRETVESRCVFSREARGMFHAVYVTKVRVTVRAEGQSIVREGSGSGEGKSASPAEAHDIALKGAETDATKRALVTFGKAFGLALYANGHARPTEKNKARATTPQPTAEINVRREPRTQRAPSLLPNGFHGPAPWRKPREPEQAGEPAEDFDGTSKLAIASESREPSPYTEASQYRRRDRNHLKFVATQPCLICGRGPSDPHHLRFAQPRALGRKVSDEYTVPLCRGHHRELHRAGNEVTWWSSVSVDPMPIARALWRKHKRNDLDQTNFATNLAEGPMI
jgi:hypothetical protein